MDPVTDPIAELKKEDSGLTKSMLSYETYPETRSSEPYHISRTTRIPLAALLYRSGYAANLPGI